MISMHQILAAKYLQAKKQKEGKEFNTNYAYLIYPDAIRAYGVARKASHFEVNPETHQASRISYDDSDGLRRMGKKDYAIYVDEDAYDEYMESAEDGYIRRWREYEVEFAYNEEDDVAPAVIGEDSSLAEFREWNSKSALPLFDGISTHYFGNLDSQLYDDLELHLKQDIVFDKTLREVVDCTGKYDDVYVVVGDGNIPSTKLDGMELRKAVNVMDNAGMLHLVGKIYELTGELCDQKWFDDNVKPVLDEELPQDLADSAYKYMKYSDATVEHITKHEFDGHDAELYDTFAMRSEDLEAMYDMMEHYYTYDKVDVPFHMADKKEKAKGDVSMGLGNDKDGDVIMGLGNDKDGSVLYLNFSNDDPVVSGMKKGIDTFDKEISVPVMIDKNNQYVPGTVGVIFDDKYAIGWCGANGDHHMIKTYPNDTWMVDAKSVSVEPKFDVAIPANAFSKNGEAVYVNMSNDAPAINTMKAGVDTFDKEVSIPGKIVDFTGRGTGKVAVAFEKPYNIGWTGGYADHHVQHFTSSESGYFFDRQDLSYEPKHEIAEPAQSMRERMAEKLKAKASNIDEHKPGSVDRSITD